MNPRGQQSLQEAALALKAKLDAARPNNRPVAQNVKPPYDGPCREDCPICHGIGWLRADLPTWHPEFGQAKPCPNVLQTRPYIQARSGITHLEQQMLDWNAVTLPNDAMNAAPIVRALVERGYGMALLIGRNGLGKSLLLKIAVAVSIRAGRFSAYAQAAAVLDEIRDAYSEDNPQESALERLGRWMESPVLCLDELGRTSNTAWANEKLFQLINQRYTLAVRNEALTLIATNMKFGELSPAIADRFQDSRCVILRFEGDSVRPLIDQSWKF
jgi:DNA replication protein DnaC